MTVTTSASPPRLLPPPSPAQPSSHRKDRQSWASIFQRTRTLIYCKRHRIRTACTFLTSFEKYFYFLLGTFFLYKAYTRNFIFLDWNVLQVSQPHSLIPPVMFILTQCKIFFTITEIQTHKDFNPCRRVYGVTHGGAEYV